MKHYFYHVSKESIGIECCS